MSKRTKSAGLVLALACVAGCATRAPRAVALHDLRPAREAGFTLRGEWIEDGGLLTNVIPAEASPADVQSSRDGLGVSIALVKDFAAGDLDLETELEFLGGAAAGLVFRVEERDEAIVAMYMLVLNSDGVHLWRLDLQGWIALHRHTMPVPERAPATLRVQIRQNKFDVFLDGQPLFTAGDPYPLAPGGAGICAREGYGRFHALRLFGDTDPTRSEDRVANEQESAP